MKRSDLEGKMLKTLKKNLIRAFRPIILPIVEDALKIESSDIVICRQKRALLETVEYIEQNMQYINSFPNDLSLLCHAVSHIDGHQNGLVCEFGVASGRTINHIADLLPKATIYGFDSFDGLPENWRDGYPKGKFRVEKLPQVRPNVKLIKGLFTDTLPIFAQDKFGSVSFIHIDCDLYSSTKTIFELLGEYIQPGTVIVFDEYFNFPCWKNEEYKAFMEFIDETHFVFEFLGYSKNQVAVKINEKMELMG